MQSCKKRPLYYWLGAAHTRLGPAKSARKQLQQQKLFFETFSWQAVRAPAPHSYCSRAQELVCTALTWHDSGPGLYITQPVLHGIANRQKAGAQFNLQKLWPASREGDKSRTPSQRWLSGEISPTCLGFHCLGALRTICSLVNSSLQQQQQPYAGAPQTAAICALFAPTVLSSVTLVRYRSRNVAVMSSHGRPARDPLTKHLNCFLTPKLCTS